MTVWDFLRLTQRKRIAEMSALQLVADNYEVQEQADLLPTFLDFWDLYPKRVAKKDATRAWAKLTPTQKVEAVTALVEWRRIWRNKDTEFLPHAATWLNGERWEDEVPQEYRQSTAAHIDAKLPEVAARTAMPDHVRKLLAKLRGK